MKKGGDKEKLESGSKAKMIDKAQAMIPKKMGNAIAGSPKGGGRMSGEKSADMKGALYGRPFESNPLREAKKEAKR